jgi:uncharacterized membrane protein
MVAHSHSAHTSAGPKGLSRRTTSRHRRALRILVVILIPLGIWTVAGLIALWPSNISGHLNREVVSYSVPGVSYPKARITAIKEISCEGLAGSTPGLSDTHCANVTAQLLEGDDKGKAVTVPLTDAIYSSGVRIGQQIQLIRVPPNEGQPAQYQFSDFVRGIPMLVIALLFAAVVVAVARWRGFASLLGLVFAGFILVKFMFPALIAGANPILVGLVGSSAIMFVVLYAAHGFSARTTTALVGTLFGLIVSAGIGFGATKWAHLTGVAAEDDYVLAAAAPDLRLTSVVICGIIVAGLGVLNDVTITQASAVWELADGGANQQHLFARAMRIGRDHIASTVYTIAFATAGAVLSVLLLIAVYNRPMLQVLQTEQFAGEVIRTLVGSIGLVLAVPLTTAVGVAVVRASGRHAPVAERGARPARLKRGSTAEEAADARDGLSAGSAARPGHAASDVEVGTSAEQGGSPEAAAAADQAESAVDRDRRGARAGRRRRSREIDDDLDFTDLHDPST